MLPNNESYTRNYKHLMSEIKKFNRDLFWSSNIKKIIINKLSKIKGLKSIIDIVSPYELQNELQIVSTNSNYVSSERIAVYTCVFGTYDEINEPLVVPDNCDFYIITDQETKTESNWAALNLDLSEYGIHKKSNIEKNRYFKMHPHHVFKNYNFSIYVDGNIEIMTDLTEFVQNMNQIGIKMHNHYRQKCIYDEIKACIKFRKDSKENLLKHMKHLKEMNMPRNYGMLEAPIIVREHNNEKCFKIMESWWEEFIAYSKRDQIALPYVLFKHGIKIEDVASLGNDIYSNYAFRKSAHNKKVRL